MRRWMGPGLALLATSCSPPGYDISVSMQGGALRFDARPNGIWPFRAPDNDITVHSVDIRSDKGVIWHIESNGDSNCLAGAPKAFPLFYGKVPACFIESAKAPALQPGARYEIQVMGAGWGDAYFRFGDPPVLLDLATARNATLELAASDDIASMPPPDPDTMEPRRH